MNGLQYIIYLLGDILFSEMIWCVEIAAGWLESSDGVVGELDAKGWTG